MLSSYCVCLIHAATPLSSFSQIRVPKNPAYFPFPFNPTFLASHSLPDFPNTKWKISCFRNQEFSSRDLKPEFTEDRINEDLLKPELDEPSARTVDWASRLQEAADSILRAIGRPWTVPWTAETILEVTLLWIASFWFVGSWVIPLGVQAAGFSKGSLTYRG